MSRHTQKPVVSDRSPLHPSALGLNDLNPGRTIILFNTEVGIIDRYEVLEHPQVTTKVLTYAVGQMQGMTVKLLSLQFDNVDDLYLEGMGVLPISGDHWNSVYFTIDASDEDLLPSPKIGRRPA